MLSIRRTTIMFKRCLACVNPQERDDVDVDTIELSNLNRQFLFRKVHVGKSKCEVACESIKQFRSDVELTPYHSSIFSFSFDSEFFRQFDIVFNALDNMAARRHVNRMCVNTSKPIIESGTSGYLGQVEPLIYLKANGGTPQSLCFECTPRANDKRTFPTCTIRNTPSEPVHCVVWAKFLFNQLFGEPDPENEDISPDTSDPESKSEAASGDQSEEEKEREISSNGSENSSLWSRVISSMNESSLNFEESLLIRLFNTDIKTLLSMDSLWRNRPDRKEPTPLEESTIKASESHQCTSYATYALKVSSLDSEEKTGVLRDQRKMPLEGWIKLFITSCSNLRKKAEIGDVTDYDKRKPLSWDKDFKDEMEFVAAASVIRGTLFHVPGAEDLTLFTTKSLAGNIIPAIATTNAIIAGAMVLQARNILEGRTEAIRTVYLHRQPAGFGRFLTTCRPEKPNPKCLVCSDGPMQEIRLYCNPEDMKLIQLKDEVLIKRLGMIAPDVQIEGTGSIIISSDGDETKDIELKTLADFKITGDGVHRLCCDDFRQSMTFILRIFTKQAGREESAWSIEGDCDSLKSDEHGKPEPPKSVGSDGPVMAGVKRKLDVVEGEMINCDEENDEILIGDGDAPAPKKARIDERVKIDVKPDILEDDDDMNPNSMKLATHAVDVMHSLPPTNPLSLANTYVRQAYEPIRGQTDSKPTELPPIYGENVDASWIETHYQIIDKLSTVREQLLKYMESSSCQAEGIITPETPVGNLSEMLKDIQEGINNVCYLVRKMENIEKASQNIQQASERLTFITLNEEISRLNTIREVSQNCYTRLSMAANRFTLAIFKPDVQRIEAYRKAISSCLGKIVLWNVLKRTFALLCYCGHVRIHQCSQGSNCVQSLMEEANFTPSFCTGQQWRLAEEAIRIAGLKPIVYREFYMTRDRAEFFYFAHQGKFFYDRLVNYMISGPIGVYVLGGESAITKWRELIGPAKVYKTVLSQPSSLRGRLGLTDTRNGFHGSGKRDCDVNAEDEILFFFPTFDFEMELKKLQS
ncbi:hypothetical protein ACTXT7_014307 [Hymenolepis weldensis]